MLHRKLVGLLVCGLVLSLASYTLAGVPNMGTSTATSAYAGTQAGYPQVSVYCLPSGLGDPINDCYWWNGGANPGATFKVNATITLTLLDVSMVPVQNYPYEDMWLESENGRIVYVPPLLTTGLSLCTNGSTADLNTDAVGVTTFSGSINAGGHSDAGSAGAAASPLPPFTVGYEKCAVIINGSPLTSGTLDVMFNSCDLDGSFQVDTTDLGYLGDNLSMNPSGVYNYRSDFYFDGIVDLSDMALFQNFGIEGCP